LGSQEFLGTVIREVGQRLEGCWTRVEAYGDFCYRYPAGELPERTGIQLGVPAGDGYFWSEPRLRLTRIEEAEIACGDLHLFGELYKELDRPSHSH
jgi:hypothetical protein